MAKKNKSPNAHTHNIEQVAGVTSSTSPRKPYTGTKTRTSSWVENKNTTEHNWNDKIKEDTTIASGSQQAKTSC
jgi:hypothetical protein